MCRSITVFRLEIERRFKAEPTLHFEPPSTDFISALGIDTHDSLIAAEQVDNMLGLLYLFISNSVSSVYFCSTESNKIDIKQGRDTCLSTSAAQEAQAREEGRTGTGRCFSRREAAPTFCFLSFTRSSEDGEVLLTCSSIQSAPSAPSPPSQVVPGPHTGSWF